MPDEQIQEIMSSLTVEDMLILYAVLKAREQAQQLLQYHQEEGSSSSL